MGCIGLCFVRVLSLGYSGFSVPVHSDVQNSIFKIVFYFENTK